MSGHGVSHRLAWWAASDADDRWLAGHLVLASPDGPIGAGPVRFEFGLVEAGQPPVLLADYDVPSPRGGGMEVRAPGLWAEVVVEEAPGDGQGHVGVGLEAFGVALEDPDDAWRGGPDHLFRGRRLPVGLDLGAEAVDKTVHGPWGTGVPCRVTGEVLVSDRTIDVDGWGWWVLDGPGSPAERLGAAATVLTMARLDDGAWFLGEGPLDDRVPGITGTVTPAGAAGRAPVLSVGPNDEPIHLDRRFGPVTGPDGRSGVGWIEVAR